MKTKQQARPETTTARHIPGNPRFSPKTTNRTPKPGFAALVPIAALTMFTHAEDKPTAAFAPETFESLWSLATLYQNDSNPILEEFKLRGRYQGQYHWVDSDQGNDDTWEDRRSRFGFDAKLFGKQIEVRADFQSNDGFEDPYDRLVDAYVRWKPDSNLSVTVGKTKPLIGYYDWLQSTNAQPTFERSQIFNQLCIDRATGLTVEGKAGEFTWQTGVYANDVDREFGTFGGDYSFGAGIGYDAKKSFGWKRADFRLDWLHSGHDEDDGVMRSYDDIVSATFCGRQGPWGIVAEGFYGAGQVDDKGDVLGLYIQPTYDLIPNRLQLVGRYSFATGDGDASLNGQRRYERSAPDLIPADMACGDQYHALYLGAQYFIYGDKLKLLAGAEYANLSGGASSDDYEGVTYLTGIRFSF
jgi:hypothetical protein